MINRPLSLTCLCTLASVLVLLEPAQAAEDICTQDPVCSSDDAAGNGSYQNGQYQDALSSYQRAFDRRPAPRLLLNIGRCHYRLKQPQKALAAFAQHSKLVPSPDPETAQKRARFIREAEELAQGSALPQEQHRSGASLVPTQIEPSRPEPPSALPSGATPARTDATKRPVKQPVYKRWELWTGIIAGAVTVGAVAGGLVYYYRSGTNRPFSRAEVY